MPRTRATEPDELTVLQMINDSLATRGYPPSQREIAAACGWKSPSGANYLIRVMEARGLIEVTPGIPRALKVTDAGAELITGSKMIASVETA